MQGLSRGEKMIILQKPQKSGSLYLFPSVWYVPRHVDCKLDWFDVNTGDMKEPCIPI